MKIAVRPLWGHHQWRDIQYPVENQLPAGGARVRFSFEEETPERILFNGEEITSASSRRQYEAVCVTGTVSRFTFLLQWKGTEPEKIELVDCADTPLPTALLRDLADFDRQLRSWVAAGIPTTASLISALHRGTLTLLMRTNPKTAVNKHWKLKEVERAVPFLNMVCQRPRLHLVIEDAIRPVEVVRRSGPAALKHLAQHSEHWRARTFTGLLPLRVLAQIVEDDWNLYENRFVITLLRRLDSYLLDIRTEVERAYRQANNSIDLMQYEGSLHLGRKSVALELLLAKVDTELIDESYVELSDLRERLSRIERHISLCKSSRFFGVLRNTRPVARPIKSTNILTKDARYRALLILWEELESSDEFRNVGGNGLLPDDLPSIYNRYCQVLLLAALHCAGFHPTDDADCLLDDIKGAFRACGTYERGPWLVNIQVDASHGTIRVSFRRLVPHNFKIPTAVRVPSVKVARRYQIHGDTLTIFEKPTESDKQRLKRLFRDPERKWLETSWGHFIEHVGRNVAASEEHELHLVPLLTRLQPDDPRLAERTRELLELSMANNRGEVISTLFLIPGEICLATPSLAANTIIRRLLNYGDSYLEGDAQTWGSYRSGILLVSRDHFNSLSRLIRLVQLNTVKKDITAARKFDYCPACNSTSVRDEGTGTSSCGDFNCQAIWGESRCSGLAGCGRTFAWLKFRGQGGVPSEKQIGRNYGKLIEELEDIPHPMTGTTPIPSFCEAFGVERHRYPICPHCGHCTAKENSASTCIRCLSV